MISNKQYIDLNEILYIQNHKISLSKWISNHRNQLSFDAYFDRYIQTIKPVIHKFFQITTKFNSNQFGFVSTLLTKTQIARLKQIYQPLNQFEVLAEQESLNKDKILILQQKVYQIIQKPADIYKMSLQIPPQNDQIKFWNHTLQIKKLIIEGVVIKGKGIGKQVLGMPTANVSIPLEVNQQLKAYPYGIYVSKVTIKGQNRTFLGASSLGTNPHYENNKSERILQIYIINDFGNENLYQKILIVQFFYLIRLQLDFKGFSPFLNGMRNDIEVTKNFKYLISTPQS